MVELLRQYSNRTDLAFDLEVATRQLAKAVHAQVKRADTPPRSVKNTPHPRQRRLTNRLGDDQVQELVAAFEAGTTREELGKRYGISRTSVAKILREWREKSENK